MDPENWHGITEADHLLLCGCWAAVGWVRTDVLLLPCSATDPPPRIRIINGYITVEPQPRGHGRSSHARSDTSRAHQIPHSLCLPLLTLTLCKIMLHWNTGGPKLQDSCLKNQKKKFMQKRNRRLWVGHLFFGVFLNCLLFLSPDH